MMKDRIKIKIAADVLMLILMPLLMLYQIIGEALHEYLGILLTLVFILHTLMNCKWYQGITKGSYSVFRTVQTVINLFSSADNYKHGFERNSNFQARIR